MHVAAHVVAKLALSFSLAVPADVDAVTSAGTPPSWRTPTDPASTGVPASLCAVPAECGAVQGSPRAPAATLTVGSTVGAVVVAIPFSAAGARELHARAASDAVEGALVKAASERGLKSTHTSLVVPVDEAARACRDDTCRVAQGKRLGARFVVIGSVDARGLSLTVVDAASGSSAPSESARIDGTPMAVLSQIPVALDGLLERVAPRRAHLANIAVARLRAARVAESDAEAARICVELAALTGAEAGSETTAGARSWEWTLAAADHYADAGMIAEARAQLLRLAADPTANEDVRVDALARSLLLKDSTGDVERSLQ